MDFETVVAHLRSFTYRYVNEAELQAHVADVCGRTARREVRLGRHGIIDVVVGRVGIECKVAGPIGGVIRQLDRYAKSDMLDGIILVTNRAAHQKVPAMLHGKPVAVVMATAGW